VPTWVAAAISIVVFAPLLGLLLEAFALRKLSGTPESARIVGTVGLAIALPAVVLFVLSELINVFHVNLIQPGPAAVPHSVGPEPAIQWHVMNGVVITSDQVLVFCFAAVTALVVWVVLRHTRIGLEMRAVVDSRRLSQMRGVDVIRSSRASWALSSMCAGMVGVVGGTILGLGDNAYILLLFTAAAPVVIARFRSIPIAFGAGLLMGFLQDLVGGYITWGPLQNTGLPSAVPFLLLLGALVVLGRARGRTAGVVADTRTTSAQLTRPTPRGWRSHIPTVVLLVVVIVYTLVIADSFWVTIMDAGLVMAVVFLSFVVVTGLGGMVSLVQSGFVTCAGLVAGFLAVGHGLPFLLAALVGIVVATLLGVLVAIPALRLSGLALALATLSLGLVFDNILFQIGSIDNQNLGWTIARPSIGPINLANNKVFALFVLFIVVVVLVLIRNFERSASGRALIAARSGAPAASSGVSIVRARVVAFALSATIAGIGGILLFTQVGTVSNTSTPTLAGLLWVTIAITFGVRRPSGAIAAGLVSVIFAQLLTYITTSTYIPLILFGLGAVALANNPDGVGPHMAEQIRSIPHALTRLLGRLRSRGVTAPPAGALESPSVSAGVDHAEPAGAAGPDHLAVAAQPPTGATAPRGAQDGSVTEGDDEPCILTLRDVRAGYDELEVLHGVNLLVREASITALLGANGGGKSTMCSVIAGVLPSNSGEITFDGESITSAASKSRMKKGMFMAPESRGVFPGLTVDENLSILLTTREERVQAYDRFPLLAARRSLPAGSLSGGEQQILTLAPAFVRKPRLLIADEPTLGLAPLVCQQLMELCCELRDEGVTLLLVEEKAKEIMAIADRVAVLELGRVVWERVKHEVDETELSEVYLGRRDAG
jgi:ABC-type branched-subunit amino acid transport system ATPase component/ABC-type branched-subunit amino acid transport system permease subunit